MAVTRAVKVEELQQLEQSFGIARHRLAVAGQDNNICAGVESLLDEPVVSRDGGAQNQVRTLAD